MNPFFQSALAILLATNQANNTSSAQPSDDPVKKYAQEMRSLNEKIDKQAEVIKSDNDQLSSLSKQVAQAQANLARVQQEQNSVENQALNQLIQENSNSLYSYTYQEAALDARKQEIEALRKKMEDRKFYLNEVEKQGFESDALKKAKSDYFESLAQLQSEEFQYRNEIAELSMRKIEDEERILWRMRDSQNDLRSQKELALKRAGDELKEAQNAYESLQQERAKNEAILEEAQDQYMTLKRDYEVLQAQRSQTQKKNYKQRNNSA